MRKAPYVLAVTAISGLALMVISSSASLLAGPLASGSGIPPALNGGLVQNVQAARESCQGKRRDWTIQQRRFCK
jgi:hypothetical protein